MNGPTEREQRWRAAIDNPDDFRGRRLRECMALADEESAILRARVAVLEQQIAAIEALIDEAVDEARRQASTDGPVDPGMLLEYLARISAALAAGVVDNPTEPGACMCGRRIEEHVGPFGTQCPAATEGSTP